MRRVVFFAFMIVILLSMSACGTTDTGESMTSSIQPESGSDQTSLSANQTTATEVSTSSKTDIVIFSDPILEEGIREAMDKPTGDITTEEAATVTELLLDAEWDPEAPVETKIQDISCLTYFVNLERLELQFHAITDISPLAGLTKLHSLALGGNNITDISTLNALVNLRFLSIFNCQATDYRPLSKLTNLQTLFISWSTFEDLTVLAELKDLTTLYIDNTLVADLSPISDLKLTGLHLDGSKVTDFAPIHDIYPNLTDKDFEMPE